MSEADIMLIEKEVQRKSFRDIAFLLDRTVDDVKKFIKELCEQKSIIPYQQLLNDKKDQSKEATKKPREKKEKKKEPKVISRIIETQLEDKRRRGRQPKFETKKVDYSQLRTVKVDEKTYIYIKPGDDPKKAIEKYKQNLNNYRHISVAEKSQAERIRRNQKS